MESFSTLLPFQVDRNNPASFSQQYLRVFLTSSLITKLTISIKKNPKIPSFFNVIENGTSYFNCKSLYNTSTYEFSRKSFDDDQYVDFVLKGMFLGSELNITSFYIRKSIDPEKKNILSFVLFTLFLYFLSSFSRRDFYSHSLAILLLFGLMCLGNHKIDIQLQNSYQIIINEYPKTTGNPKIEIIQKAIPSILKFQEFDHVKCKLCDFKPINTSSNSSPKDLIFTAALGQFKNLNAFIRTCRTCNCKATIIIFTNFDITKEQEMYKDCGVFFFNMGGIYPKYRQKSGARYKFIANFLNQFPDGTFNRIVYSDLYDTLFQGDPFLTTLKPKTLYVSAEIHLFRWSPWFYYQKFDGTEIMNYPFNYILDRNLICAGTLIGSEHEVKVMFNAIANWMKFNPSENNVDDQIFYDIFLYSNILEEIGSHIKFVSSGDFITSCEGNWGDYTQDSYPSYCKLSPQWIPLILHHSNRLYLYHPMMNKKCEINATK